MSALNRYLAGVLTVIALGVSVIAYHLAFPGPAVPRDGASLVTDWSGAAPVTVGLARPVSQDRLVTADGRVLVYDEAQAPRVYRAADEPMVVARPVRTVDTVETVEVVRQPRRVTTRTVERGSGRDWKRTAMIIGGSTAAGAGVGGIVGGKKGALIGAAIAGGVSTIHQTR
jgi:hypothetical protein